MIIINEGIEPEWYTPESEINEDEPTRFKIKPLTGERLDQVMQGSTGGELTSNGKSYAIAYGLVDWENFKVRTDNDKVIDKKFSLNDTNLIPYDVRRELAFKIADISNLTSDNEKN